MKYEIKLIGDNDDLLKQAGLTHILEDVERIVYNMEPGYTVFVGNDDRDLFAVNSNHVEFIKLIDDEKE